MRSNSLSTRGCGERMQTVSFVEVRFVVTVRQIIENWPKGQVLWCVCSRIVTDIYGAWLRGTPFNRIPIMRFAVWPSQGEECGMASGELTVRWADSPFGRKKR